VKDNQISSDDGQLVEQMKRGNHDAFSLLYLRHKGSIHAYCVQLLRDPEEAKDVVQETFLRMQGKLETLRNGMAFRVWAFSIARNLIFNRKRDNHLVLGDDSEPLAVEDDPFESSVRKETSEIVRSGINRLKPALREVLQLRIDEDLSYKEIAGLTGVTEETVKIRLYRGRKALVQYITKLGEIQR
jgi:RNA polymerase sigma-70 factor (ECF subfamily)